MRLPTICAVFASWASAQSAFAADIEVRDLDSGDSLIAVTGEIVKGDAAKFKKIAAALDGAVVVLDSDGGATIEAIEIGETIRLKGFSTLVINGTTCTSACGLIWLSGSPRVLSNSAQIGFHATYTDKSGSRMESGVGNALVGRYLAVLNLPQKAIVFATSAPPERLNWLTASNASSYGIDVKLIDDFEPKENSRNKSSPTLDRAPDPPPITTYPTRPPQNAIEVRKGETTVWSRSTDWTILVDHTLDNSCYIVRTFADGTLFRIGFDVKNDNGHYFLIGNRNWTSLKVGTNYPIKVQFDNEGAWEANSEGIDLGGTTMLHAKFDDNVFWAELATAEMVTFSRNGKAFGQFRLGDSSTAIDQVIACQKAPNQTLQRGDPFAE